MIQHDDFQLLIALWTDHLIDLGFVSLVDRREPLVQRAHEHDHLLAVELERVAEEVQLGLERRRLLVEVERPVLAHLLQVVPRPWRLLAICFGLPHSADVEL